MAKVQLKLAIKANHRATAEEQRQFGGDTVTEFYVTRGDTDETRVFTGYGPTPEDRQRSALAKSSEFWKLKGGPRSDKSTNFYVWSVVDEKLGAEVGGPLTFRQAKDLGRIRARESEHDHAVTEGNDPISFKLRRGYKAGTGAVLFRV